MRLLSFLFCLLLLFSCKQNRKDFSLEDTPSSAGKQTRAKHITGNTMGTSYSIKYLLSADSKVLSKKTIDSTLVSINDAVSTYIPSSTISKFNQSEKGISLNQGSYPNQHFIQNYLSSEEIYKETDGQFDPSVMPLVNYWGFGYEGKNPVTSTDTTKISEILKFVGFDLIAVEAIKNELRFSKQDARSTLDFSAIAKGYAVDYLSTMLESNAINSYMVEIGGEVKVKGRNSKGQYWKLGINTPEKGAAAHDIQVIVNPKEKALASSGNYRIFHEVNGNSYGHEINPKTGYPQVTDILSASVLHDDCAYADAYATAFMIMGLEKSLKFANENQEVDVCLIIEEQGKLKNIFSQGFESYIVQ